MAAVYYDGTGNILAYSHTDAEDAALFPTAPAGTTALPLDELTNQNILNSLDGKVPGFRFQDHKVVAGALQRSGVPMTVSPDHPATTDRKQVKANLAAIFTALRAGTATNAQVQRVLAFLLRQFLQG